MDVGPVSSDGWVDFVTRSTALFGQCTHPRALPVEAILTGDRVAWLCPDCDVQLPADWRNPLDALKKPGAGC
jgi:hypothetical protein